MNSGMVKSLRKKFSRKGLQNSKRNSSENNCKGKGLKIYSKIKLKTNFPKGKNSETKTVTFMKIKSEKINKSSSWTGLKEGSCSMPRPRMLIISKNISKNRSTGSKKMTRKSTISKVKSLMIKNKKIERGLLQSMQILIIHIWSIDSKNRLMHLNLNKPRNCTNIKKWWQITPIMQWVSSKTKNKSFFKKPLH